MYVPRSKIKKIDKIDLTQETEGEFKCVISTFKTGNCCGLKNGAPLNCEELQPMALDELDEETNWLTEVKSSDNKSKPNGKRGENCKVN